MDNIFSLNIKTIRKQKYFSDEIYVGKLISEVKSYIKVLEGYDYDVVSLQKDCELKESQTYHVFRRLERTQYNIWVMQYMSSFIKKLPLEEDIAKEIVNPYDQFRAFVQHNVRLLNNKDVIESVLRDLRDRGLLKSSNFINCKLWIYKKFKEILGFSNQSYHTIKEGWKNLFTGIKCHSLFWFFIRQEETQKIRRADILIYLMATILIERLATQNEQLLIKKSG